METLNTIPVRKEPRLDGLPHEAYKVLGRDPELVAMLAQEATSLLSGKDALPYGGVWYRYRRREHQLGIRD